MESNDYNAREITESLKREETMQAKRFMKQTEDHFRISCSEDKDFQMIKFVADKSFRYGFQKGMMAVFDAMDAHRERMMRNN